MKLALNKMDGLDPLIDRIGDARYVLLGEASHGTHEYYTWRAHISKRLIEEKGFSFIAVEGDWPDCFRINRFIKGYQDTDKKASDVLRHFNRWPTWMWANWEVAALVDWLKKHNTSVNTAKKVGFYGLDVYSLWESMEAMSDYLIKEDPHAAKILERAIRCFEPYGEEEQEYAMATKYMSQSCHDELIRLLREIRAKSQHYDHDPEARFNTEQNAFVAVNAEKYYRAMVSFGPDSWNIRDTHMAETLDRLMNYYGPEAKCIVWEHNTHIGDARATDMASQGMVNVGQLVREVAYRPQDVVLVGFGSYEGAVIASREWGAPMQEMEVPQARPGSIEAILHKEAAGNQLLIFNDKETRERFSRPLNHRAIGVVYHPEREKHSNYVPSILASRYDAFIFIDQTKALHPLHMEVAGLQMPDTYPFGV